MHNTLIKTFLIMLMLGVSASSQIDNNNYIIASLGSCIDYAPKVCLLKSGVCYDTPCPDCTCRIWISDNKGKQLVNGAQMSVTGAKTCCYIAKEPQLMEGGTYTGYFNAVSPTYGEGNDSGTIYVTAQVSTSLYNGATSQQNVFYHSTATSQTTNISDMDYCGGGISNSCTALENTDCTKVFPITVAQFYNIGPVTGCYVAKGICSAGGGGSAQDSLTCYFKFMLDIFNLLKNVIGSLLLFIKGTISFIVGISNSETRTETLENALIYIWDFINSILIVIAPLVVIGELFIIYNNCRKDGIEVMQGFIVDNFRFFSIIATVISYILGIFLGIMNMFYGMIFGIKPK